MVDDSRPRGILSEKDREYLREREEYGDTRQARHKRKKAIEERLRNAILDFELIAAADFPEEFVEAVRDLPDDDVPEEEMVSNIVDGPKIHPEIRKGVVEMLAFQLRLTYPWPFELFVKYGVERGLARWFPDTSVGECRVDLLHPESMAERAKWLYEEGEHLTDRQISLLLRHDMVPPDELAKHVKETAIEMDYYPPEPPDGDFEP